jgi:hypothetical protein
MDNKILSDVATGIFRLRMDDPHMTDSTIVDVHDDEYTTLTTVEVRSGVVVLHCHVSWAEEVVREYVLKDDEEEEEAEEEEESEDDEKSDEDDEEEESDDEEESEEEEGTKTYTIASGNSVTVRASMVRLEPIGLETAEGVYRVQMMKAD